MKKFYKKYKQLIPVLVMLYFCCMTGLYAILGVMEFAGDTYYIILSYKHYAGFLAVAINLISFFFFRRHYKVILLVTLLLGLINLLNFAALNNTIGFAIGSLGIEFQATSFLIILLTLLINVKRVYSVFKLNPKHVAEFERQRWSEQVHKFKEQYSKYSSEELNNMIVESKYAPEAKEAARQLLTERKPNT